MTIISETKSALDRIAEDNLLIQQEGKLKTRELKELLTKRTALQDEYQNTNSELEKV